MAAHRLVMRVVRERHAETGDLAAVTDGAVRALQASASTIGDAWQDPAGVVTWPPAVSAVTNLPDRPPGRFTGEMSGELLKGPAAVGLPAQPARRQHGPGHRGRRPLAGDCERVLGAGHPAPSWPGTTSRSAFRRRSSPAEAIPILEQKASPGSRMSWATTIRDTMTVAE